ncbi:phage tail protein [Paenibacillus chibensis]|uniref:Phage tail protein n=1 Tax=Paenibacillus chibensis TaxID=59846 RepID=A0ABU6PVN7_9BACL|nr:phage tail protein [Paenibacillus chibensis]
MASNTPNLGLLKKDPATDGNETFNIKTLLNDNWDKIDEAVGNIQVPEASTTQKGIVQLSNATDGTREDVAATERAVKAAYERGSEGVNAAGAANTKADFAQSNLTAHLADYVHHAGFAVSAGTATAYIVALDPAPTALVAGMTVRFKAHVDSGANPTVNPNGLGAKSAKKPNGNAASFKKDGIYTVTYDGSGAFILQGEGGEYGTATAADVRNTKTLGTDSGLIAGALVTQATTPQIITPGTSNIVKAAGIYDDTITILGDANLVPANILLGKSIFGISGSLKKSVYGISVLSINKNTSVPASSSNLKNALLFTFPAGTSIATFASSGVVVSNAQSNSMLQGSNANCRSYLTLYDSVGTGDTIIVNPQYDSARIVSISINFITKVVIITFFNGNGPYITYSTINLTNFDGSGPFYLYHGYQNTDASAQTPYCILNGDLSFA